MLATQCAILNMESPIKKIETAIAKIELWMIELDHPINKMHCSIFMD
jgi:hypothetical protein